MRRARRGICGICCDGTGLKRVVSLDGRAGVVEAPESDLQRVAQPHLDDSHAATGILMLLSSPLAE